MPQLTVNIDVYVTQDGDHFCVRHLEDGRNDGGYRLGETAHFQDEGREYSVTVNKKGSNGEFLYEVQFNKL